MTASPHSKTGIFTANVAALLLCGGAMIAVAQAQSEGTRIELVPMPNTLPQVLFSPDSLAGTMLEPLSVPETSTDTAAAGEGDGAVEPPQPPLQGQLPSEALAQANPKPMEEPAAGSSPEEDPVDEPKTPAAQVKAPPAKAEVTAEPETPAGSGVTLVHVIVENVESSSGTVNVAVCDTDFTPEGCPYKTSVPASAGFVEARFEGVPPGDYAVVGYHDVNNNDEFDKFLGVPREPYALSGGAAEELVPEFRDAILKINQGENYVIIRMKRLGSG